MKRNFIIQFDDADREALAEVAASGHMDDTKYAAVWLKELSTLRPEYSLKVLGLIPDEWKKRRPGRPPATARAANASTTRNAPKLPSEDVA